MLAGLCGWRWRGRNDMAREHPLVTHLREIRDRWRTVAEAMIGTRLMGSNFQRLAADRGNEADKLLWAFMKEEEKLKTKPLA